MSNMDGNPHYFWDWSKGLVLHNDDPQGEALAAQVDATLALAYEQRTANLLHALELCYRAQSFELQVDPNDVAARLGMDGATP